MDAWIWIIVGLIAIPALWWVTKVLTSFVVPVSSSGRAYLKQELRKRGIDPRQIPDACVDDFVDFAQKVSAFPGRSGAHFRAEVVRTLDTIADLFILWRKSPDDSMFQQYGESKNYYREIFERYGIE